MNGYVKNAGRAMLRCVGISNFLAITLILLAGMCVVSGCSSLRVYSNPPGAKVFVNEADTGRTTPTKIRVRNLALGRQYIMVEKEGYRTITPKQEVDVAISIGSIVMSWWPPVLIKNLCDNFWKGIAYPPRGHISTFELQEVLEQQSPTKQAPIGQ